MPDTLPLLAVEVTAGRSPTTGRYCGAFCLPLPAQGLNHGYVLGRGRIYKSPELVAWEQEVALLHVRDWTPPKRTPLQVGIMLMVPAKKLRQVDADGYVKCLVDAVVGKRRDAWVDRIYLEKVAADGEPRCYVTVEALASGAGEGE